MPPLTIDTQEITPDLLLPCDSPVLADVVREAFGPAEPAPDGAGFDNRV